MLPYAHTSILTRSIVRIWAFCFEFDLACYNIWTYFWDLREITLRGYCASQNILESCSAHTSQNADLTTIWPDKSASWGRIVDHESIHEFWVKFWVDTQYITILSQQRSANSRPCESASGSCSHVTTQTHDTWDESGPVLRHERCECWVSTEMR